MLSPLSFILEDNQITAFSPDNRWKFMAALLYSVLLVSIFAHASYYWLLARQPMYRVAVSGVITTFFGVAMGIIILGEPITVHFIVGGFLAVLGVLIILWRNTSKEKQQSESQITSHV